MIDIDALEAALAAGTPRPWAHRMGEIVQLSDGGAGYPIDYYPDCADVVAKDRDGDLSMSDADADLIVAAVNCLGPLLDVYAAACAWVDERRDMRIGIDEERAWQSLEAAIDRARAK